MLQTILCIGILLGLIGCSTFQRSPRSGYANDSIHHSDQNQSSNQENHQIAAEMGYSSSEELSTEQYEAIAKRRHLRHLESRMDTRREREQYSKILPWLMNDDEKIEFLSIENLEGRQAWAQSKGIWKRSQAPGADMKDQIESGDISVGMTMEHVKKSWGEPQSTEVSGNPLYHNERWKYVRFVSSQDGYRQEKRFVYFEGGRVVGWETE